ncbi:MAG TPA: phosphoribosylamine--glycine ligase [Candidatus Sulfopaludibacter sp.]|jgi:phosphoribosylamine--glycine ligase|nr:phosphoribosylamine--glycine ligase [Candidatus Sulfopaludibacter sp.]
MKILVVGSGGREHALAWKLAQSPGAHIFSCPGNPGMAAVGACLPPGSYLDAAESIDADLTVVGPEVPLVDGIVDQFRARGRRIVGPDSKAAQLEGSKIFAKSFLQQSSIPTAAFVTVDTPEDARKALARFGFPVVLKADGLAAGKGVVIAHDAAEAEAALTTLQGRLVVEEFLTGEEISFIALCDGKNVVPLAPTQDHKAVYDGDAGPNTGGMGAYCDSRLLTEAQTREILDRVIYPTVEAMQFTGFLYAGLMMTASGPKVLEFNVRLGDPETQPLMHRMASDFVPALMAAAEGDLSSVRLEWRAGPSVCVVAASEGYPGAYPSGRPIRGIEAAEATGATVFQAGTRPGVEGIETAGGRVLGVTASGADLAEAIDRAYAGVREIHFTGMHYRHDIGRKGLRRYNGSIVGT